MKKILSVIILSTFLSAGTPKPAHALIIDPGQIAAKIAEIVQDIADAVQMGIQEVDKVKQMAVQGFNNDIFREKATEFAKFGIDYAKYTGHKLISKQFKQVEGDTKAQNKKVLEKDQENYQQATQALYQKQLETLELEIKNTEEAKKEAEKNRNDAKSKETQAKADYEAETSPEAKNQKLVIYMKYSAEAEKWDNDYNELDKKGKELLEQKKKLTEEMGKIGSDAQSKNLAERVSAMENEKNKLITQEASKTTEWDEVNPEDYDINKYYKDFTEQYFYDPAELGDDTQGSGGSAEEKGREHGNEGVIKYQSRIDRIMRQRRYLVVNSAAHLMQVAATMRRSLPVEYKKNKEMFTTIGQDMGEFAAKEVYSSTRVESARALLMYAKLLCAKLQYETARDLIKSDVERKMSADENTESNQFDLGKYILNEDDVAEMMAKFSYGEETDLKAEYNKKSNDDKFEDY